MEIIKNITEVSDVYFDNKWNTYDGYCIETDSRQLYFVINNGQDCCENWGYLSSEDDFGSFIGSELKNVYVTDSELGTIVSNMKEDLDAGSAMFINVETTNGLLQFVAYNEQLGYECNVFDLFIHDATKAFVNAEFKLKIGVILPVTKEQFIEANKSIKDIVNTDTAIINCGAYGKGRIYHLEYTKLADSERGRL